MVFSANHIRKSFLDEQLLKDASFRLEDREKAALVGTNGAGKTTLLRILTGELDHDGGDLSFQKDVTIGYLKQVSDLNSELSVYLEAMRCKESVMKLEQEMRDIETALEKGGKEDPEALLKRHERLLFEFEAANGYAMRSEVTGILKGLGFPESEFGKPVSALSGGEKTRLSLAKLLVERPGLLLLDEPTNHLDMSGIRFLETAISAYPGSVLVVSHDRYFLDRTVTKIIDLEAGVTRIYTGNYTAFTEKKRALKEAERRAYEAKKQEIAHQEAVIEKLRSFNREKSIKRAESREKMLEKLGPLEKPFEDQSRIHLRFTQSVSSGNDVLKAEGLMKAFGERTLFTNASFDIKRGEKVVLIGDNGAGKTTLFRLILGELSPDAGTVRLGTNVEFGYYDQTHARLTPEKTVFDEIRDTYPNLDNTEVRTRLAAFLFTGDDVFKRISELSGGERGRVLLAKLMLMNANFLLLDEPTNHLDMAGKEVLEEALSAYEGTVLAISHDRYFINRIADRILELYQGTLIAYPGNYDYYLEKRDEFRARLCETERAAETAVSGEKEARLLKKEEESRRRRHEKAIAVHEAEIDALTKKIDSIDREMADPANASDAEKLLELQKNKTEAEERLSVLYAEWEALLEES